MNVMQYQYDLIYSFFKTTTEPFDELEWNGKLLFVIFDGKVIEKYSYADLRKIIKKFK
jgi:hypothetical protein